MPIQFTILSKPGIEQASEFQVVRDLATQLRAHLDSEAAQ
jgi:hypothetical protein